MKDSIGAYLDEIGAIDLLDKDQERELAQTVERGREAERQIAAGGSSPVLHRTARLGSDAKERFIRANLRLVVSIARRYPTPHGMDLGDLIQEGNIGLEHAVDRFDWRRGFRFSTYATYWVRQSIGRAVDQKGSLIRLPSARASRLRSALRTVAAEPGGELNPEQAYLHRLANPVSTDRSVSEDDRETAATLGDLLADSTPGPDEVIVDSLQAEAVAAMLDQLDVGARRAVALRFGFVDGTPHSFREVGDTIGVSGEAARRMVDRALERLRPGATSALVP